MNNTTAAVQSTISARMSGLRPNGGNLPSRLGPGELGLLSAAACSGKRMSVCVTTASLASHATTWKKCRESSTWGDAPGLHA
jgi:hypothetical protein